MAMHERPIVSAAINVVPEPAPLIDEFHKLYPGLRVELVSRLPRNKAFANKMLEGKTGPDFA